MPTTCKCPKDSNKQTKDMTSKTSSYMRASSHPPPLNWKPLFHRTNTNIKRNTGNTKETKENTLTKSLHSGHHVEKLDVTSHKKIKVRAQWPPQSHNPKLACSRWCIYRNFKPWYYWCYSSTISWLGVRSPPIQIVACTVGLMIWGYAWFSPHSGWDMKPAPKGDRKSALVLHAQ